MVCKICQNGKYVSFTTQTSGFKAACYPLQAPCPNDSTPVATWHTHGGDDPRYDTENFSDADEEDQNGDIPNANKRNMDSYLITPKDQFKQYIPSKNGNGTVIDRGNLYY